MSCAGGCRGQERLGQQTYVQRSLALLAPDQSLQLPAHLRDKVSMVPVHPSFIKCLEGVQGRIGGSSSPKCGNGGAATLEWEKVQWRKGKRGLPPTAN